MAPLKFRAWHKNQKKMYSDVQVGGFPETVAAVWREDEGEGADWVNLGGSHDEYVVMQSTGLLDKNGKEIFEGDVVQGWGGKPFVVEYGGWSCDCCQRVYGYAITDTEAKYREVIGNIYENPDLLPQS